MAFLSEATRRALEGLGRLEASSDSYETARGDATPDEACLDASLPLERIRAIRQVQRALESESAVLVGVRHALERGASWEEIAAASGLRPAAAKWRWQGTNDEIAARFEAGRKRSVRPSSIPTELPGQSVADAARTLGVTAQAIYLRVSRGTLESTTVVLDDGRRYKRVMLP